MTQPTSEPLPGGAALLPFFKSQEVAFPRVFYKQTIEFAGGGFVCDDGICLVVITKAA